MVKFRSLNDSRWIHIRNKNVHLSYHTHYSYDFIKYFYTVHKTAVKNISHRNNNDLASALYSSSDGDHVGNIFFEFTIKNSSDIYKWPSGPNSAKKVNTVEILETNSRYWNREVTTNSIPFLINCWHVPFNFILQRIISDLPVALRLKNMFLEMLNIMSYNNAIHSQVALLTVIPYAFTILLTFHSFRWGKYYYYHPFVYKHSSMLVLLI